jgi:ribosomal protein S3
MENQYFKSGFLSLLDGSEWEDQLFPEIDSYRLGICKLEVIDNTLHVYLRRPGLLIGKKGEVINTFLDRLKIPIFIHEFNLLK